MQATKLLSLLSLTAVMATAQADMVTISPMLGDHDFSDNTAPDQLQPPKKLQNSREFNLGLGYRYTPNWGVEASFGWLRAHDNAPYAASQLGYRSDDLNLTYRFLPDAAIQPYVLAGAGVARYAPDSTYAFYKKYGQLGAGLVVPLFKQVSLRYEARYMDMPGPHWHDWVGLVGLEVGLGSFDAAPVAAAEPAPAPVVAAVPEPAPAPAPAPVVAQAPADDDHDGVPNDIDKCPNTPEGVKVDAVGCPLDSDHDGVPDYLDKCPDTKPGAAVDANGCYVMLKESQSISLDVNFASGKAVILGNASAELQKVVDFMRKYPNVDITVEGYTDNRGSPVVNRRLSQRRADAVRTELVKMGADAGHLKAKGYGSAHPIASNKTEAGRAKNRRVVATAKGEGEVIKMKN